MMINLNKMDAPIIEKLADLEHEQWIHLVSFFASLPPDVLRAKIYGEDYKRLRFTKYENLTEKEKESDRVWARKVAEIISEEIVKHKNCKVMHDLGKHGQGEMTCLDKVLESLGYKKIEK